MTCITYLGVRARGLDLSGRWTRRRRNAEAIPNVIGYVIGTSRSMIPRDKGAGGPLPFRAPASNQTPEFHTFELTGTAGFDVRDVRFGHSYGYPSEEELWRFENWMTGGDERYTLQDEPLRIDIDWEGLLPYPEGLK
jgi:hypothetical protein